MESGQKQFENRFFNPSGTDVGFIGTLMISYRPVCPGGPVFPTRPSSPVSPTSPGSPVENSGENVLHLELLVHEDVHTHTHICISLTLSIHFTDNSDFIFVFFLLPRHSQKNDTLKSKMFLNAVMKRCNGSEQKLSHGRVQ